MLVHENVLKSLNTLVYTVLIGILSHTVPDVSMVKYRSISCIHIRHGPYDGEGDILNYNHMCREHRLVTRKDSAYVC